jgi:hypothetical protein
MGYLAEKSAATLQEIMDAADVCAPITAKKAVYSLVEKSKVYRTDSDGTGRGNKAKYALKKE